MLIRFHRFATQTRFFCRPMSFQAAIKNLSPRIRDLVLAVTQNGERYVGETDKDREEVSGWVEKTSQGQIASSAKFQVCCIVTCNLGQI